MTTRLPVLLETVRIATPCNADWDEMAGDERVRFCGQCEKSVYNLSAMTRDEAEELLGVKEGRLCVRLYQRKDGTVLTADCPVGVRRERLRRRVWASLSRAVAAAALVFGLGAGRARADLTLADGKHGTKQPPPQHVLMGGARAHNDVPPDEKAAKEPPRAKMGERAVTETERAATDANR